MSVRITNCLRFKTKKEFEKEYGKLWGEKVPLRFSDEMGYLLGKYIVDISKEITFHPFKHVFFTFSPKKYTVYVSYEMLTRGKRLFKYEKGNVFRKKI